MPRAFLMQYAKRERVEVVLQEADTTHEGKHHQRPEDPVDVKMKPEVQETKPAPYNHMGNPVAMREDSDDEDIEISVTDESEEEEEEEEEEDEEIIVGIEGEPMPDYAQPNGPMRAESERNDMRTEDCKRKDIHRRDYSAHDKRHRHYSESEDTCYETRHSAFTKPPHFSNLLLPYTNSTPRSQSELEIDVGTYLDHRTAMANYWLHLSKLYGSQMGMPHIGHLSAHMSIPSPPGYPLTAELLQKRSQLMHNGFHKNGNIFSPPVFPTTNGFCPPGFPFPYSGLLTTQSLPGNSHLFREPGEIGIRQSHDRAKHLSGKVELESRFSNNHASHNRQSESISPNSRRDSLSSIPTPTSPIQSPSFSMPTPGVNLHASSFPFPPPEALLRSPHIPGTTSHITDSVSDGGRFSQVHSGMGFFLPPVTNTGYGTRRPRDPNKPPPVKKYKCDLCGKSFSRSNTLVTHRRIHTGEKPFKCEVCARAFRQPGNLTRHRLTHTSVKPYICVVCKKAFNRASNLHTHMRTHSNFRPFLCPYCGKGFQQKVDLKIHMYTHANRH